MDGVGWDLFDGGDGLVELGELRRVGVFLCIMVRM